MARKKQQQPQHEQEEEEYVVEHISGEKRVKVRGGGFVIKYKVKWKGYPNATWEPESNLDNCRQKIEDFRARNGSLATRPPRSATGPNVSERAEPTNVGNEPESRDAAANVDNEPELGDAPIEPAPKASGKKRRRAKRRGRRQQRGRQGRR
jgi:hypothetical protein